MSLVILLTLNYTCTCLGSCVGAVCPCSCSNHIRWILCCMHVSYWHLEWWHKCAYNVNNFNTMAIGCLTHSPRNSQLRPLLLQHLVPLLFLLFESENHITNQLCYSMVVEFVLFPGTCNNYTSITFAIKLWTTLKCSFVFWMTTSYLNQYAISNLLGNVHIRHSCNVWLLVFRSNSESKPSIFLSFYIVKGQ